MVLRGRVAAVVVASMMSAIGGTGGLLTTASGQGKASAAPPPPVAVSVLPVALPGESVPARDLPAADDDGPGGSMAPRVNPLAGADARPPRRDVDVRDRLIRTARTRAVGVRAPAAFLVFDGTGNPLGCDGCSPPDTTGDVGPHHYIQMVNSTKVSVFDKNGTLLRPAFDLSTLFTSAMPTSACATFNAGDPQVLYDPMADRWLLSQFTPRGSNSLCFAVSRTPDPLGAYHLYQFQMPDFPDYFKVGVWPTGFYLSTNESSYAAYAFDRTKMLAGLPASAVRVDGATNFLMPADVDGSTSPDNQGGLFYTFKDSSFHGGTDDRLELFQLTPDFVEPGKTAFTMVATVSVTPFRYTVCGFFELNCIPQKDTDATFDAVSEWPMQRFAYRRFADHEALVGNFTVGGGTATPGAAIRWFELGNSGAGWTLEQEGTQDLGDGLNRFMGSIAMDADGNIALGYSASSSDEFPSVRYATRLAADPPGTLQTERTLLAGGGSQTGFPRWGDYSAMSVDEGSDHAFWYTNEYYATTSSADWSTVIGSFGFRAQTIDFPRPPNVRITAASVTLTATGGGSTSPVVFASTTPATCTTSGTDGAIVFLVEVGTCTVTANQAGDGTYSAARQVTRSFTIVPPVAPPPPPIAPGAPTGVTATAGDGLASVSWTAPQDPGSSPIIGYTVVAVPGPGTCSVAFPATECVVTGLVNGTPYTFAVAASSAAGTGPTSAASLPVTPTAGSPTLSPTTSPSPPPAPTVTVASPTARSPISSGAWFGVTAAVSPVPDLAGSTAYVTLDGVAIAQTELAGDGTARFERVPARVGSYRVRIGPAPATVQSQPWTMDIRPFGITGTDTAGTTSGFTVATGNWSPGTTILLTRDGRRTASVAVGTRGAQVSLSVPRVAGRYQVRVATSRGWAYGQQPVFVG